MNSDEVFKAVNSGELFKAVNSDEVFKAVNAWPCMAAHTWQLYSKHVY